MAKWTPLEENIFLMCQTCAKHLVEAGQMMMDLPTPEPDKSSVRDGGLLNQEDMEAARALLQDARWLETLGTLLTSKGSEGNSKELASLYALAIDIKNGRYREGPNGWYAVT